MSEGPSPHPTPRKSLASFTHEFVHSTRQPPGVLLHSDPLTIRRPSPLLNPSVDTWAALRQSEPGKTFDGQSNPVCVHDRDERMRYDRIMLKSRTVVPTGGGGGGLAAWWRQVRGVDEGPSAAWTAASIDMVGTEPINDWNLKLSDHYGLVLEVRPAGGGC